jgi:uncharacterized protein YaaR (DUF327 family)
MPDFLDIIRRSRKPSVSSAKPDGKSVVSSAATNEAAIPEPVENQFFTVLSGKINGPVEKRLEDVLKDIKRLSDILIKRRLLEDLEEYRARVGDFLKIYMDEALTVREASGRRRGLRRKQFVVVKRVNIELEELSKMVLGGAPDFKILKELGTIEGLLMDLYR